MIINMDTNFDEKLGKKRKQKNGTNIKSQKEIITYGKIKKMNYVLRISFKTSIMKIKLKF